MECFVKDSIHFVRTRESFLTCNLQCTARLRGCTLLAQGSPSHTDSDCPLVLLRCQALLVLLSLLIESSAY
jgi:hypothetical protein